MKTDTRYGLDIEKHVLQHYQEYQWIIEMRKTRRLISTHENAQNHLKIHAKALQYYSYTEYISMTSKMF